MLWSVKGSRSFTDPHRWVTELVDFRDDPKASSEGKLEAIQMAWWEEWKEGRDVI